VLVVDAGVLATALGDDDTDGDRARARLRGEALAAPDLVDLEVASVLRGRLAGGHLSLRRAELALEDLVALPLDRVAPLRLIPRCSELCDNLTVYDAAYVALAETLAVPLLTADSRLARATGPQCSIELLVS
jgi:predicted nucleic acid-binding protein